MSEILEVLHCKRCRAAVALVVETAAKCAYCGAKVDIPPKHAEALRLSREGQSDREKACVRLQSLGDNPQVLAISIATVAILTLPALAVTLARHYLGLELSRLELNIYAGVPGILPGIGLYIWAAAVRATGQRFCDTLSASPPTTKNGRMSCRRCAGPLIPSSESHVICCPYCQSDNLLRGVCIDTLQEHQRSSLQTLDQALHLMRVRRGYITLGILFALAISCGLIAVVQLAQF